MVTKAVGNLLTIAIVMKRYLPPDNGAPTFYSEKRHFERNVAKKSHSRSLVSPYSIFIRFISSSFRWKARYCERDPKQHELFWESMLNGRKQNTITVSQLPACYHPPHNYFYVAKYSRIRHHSLLLWKICNHKFIREYRILRHNYHVKQSPIDPHIDQLLALSHYVCLSKKIYSLQTGFQHIPQPVANVIKAPKNHFTVNVRASSVRGAEESARHRFPPSVQQTWTAERRSNAVLINREQIQGISRGNTAK